MKRAGVRSHPGPDCVAVPMFWQGGTRQEVLKVPVELERQIFENDMASTDDAISIGSALAYGLMLSISVVSRMGAGSAQLPG